MFAFNTTSLNLNLSWRRRYGQAASAPNFRSWGYINVPKFWDIQFWTNNVEPGQTAADQGLHYLPFILHLLDINI